MAQVPTTWMAPNTAPSNKGALELSIADRRTQTVTFTSGDSQSSRRTGRRTMSVPDAPTAVARSARSLT